ncbi:hypothetical protein IC575_028469 [Cucumis melo]
MCHGYNSSKDMYLPASQEFIDELKICIVLYDRAGYGESDRYPARSVKSEAFDIQELADKLQVSTKYYVIGCSIRASSIWSCLKYIPHRCFSFISLLSIIFQYFTCLASINS